jgi:uncharacterized protein (TIGR03437 family)
MQKLPNSTLFLVLAGSVLHAESPILRLSASSAVVHPGDEVTITYSLAGPSAIAGFQWDEDVDSRLSVSDKALGPSLAVAGKNLQCASNRCVALGVNQNVIGEGPLATAVVSVSPDAATGRATLRLHRVLAAAASGGPAELQSGPDLAFMIVEQGAPGFLSESLVNAASYEPGLTPGALATVFGVGLSNVDGVADAGGATSFQGVTVLVNGRPAPLLSVVNLDGWEQINLQTPFETALGPAVVEIERDGKRTAAGAEVFAAQPGIFEILLEGGARAVAAQHPDGQLVHPGNPARRGEAVAVFLTGGGAVMPFVETGALGPVPAAEMAAPAGVTLGGIRCVIEFAGYAPGLMGVYQINFAVPESAPSGAAVELVMEVGGHTSNTAAFAVE